MKFASIDIGSNAIRLLFCNVYEGKPEPVFKKDTFIRVPLRLGDDAFTNHVISEKKIKLLIKTMAAFKQLMDVYGVMGYRAFATSAMREAANSKEIVERVKAEAGIKIEVIDGKKEAEVIYSNHIAEHLNKNKSYLYIDVGGGSTELTLFSKNKIIASTSFNIGTIRLLKKQITKSDFNSLKVWMDGTLKGYKDLIAIGSGGNIAKIFKFSGKEEGELMSYGKLKDIAKEIEKYSYEDRIKILGLNPDRADVILPAADIFTFIMKTANVKKILVPKLGLSDGIIHLLYENFSNKKKNSKAVLSKV